MVPLPDVRGREQILKVHMRKVPLSDDVKPSIIARGTPGFSGADLANLVNEAALFAARANRRTVTMEEFEKAKDKIMMGAERRSMVMNEAEKKLTAYHEAGHAIVGLTVPDHDPVYKVSIIPRGRALGVTMFLPEEDRYSYSKRRLNSQIASLFGGRIAEELVWRGRCHHRRFHDIERATDIAGTVTNFARSDRLDRLPTPRRRAVSSAAQCPHTVSTSRSTHREECGDMTATTSSRRPPDDPPRQLQPWRRRSAQTSMTARSGTSWPAAAASPRGLATRVPARHQRLLWHKPAVSGHRANLLASTAPSPARGPAHCASTLSVSGSDPHDCAAIMHPECHPIPFRGASTVTPACDRSWSRWQRTALTSHIGVSHGGRAPRLPMLRRVRSGSSW